MLNCHHSVIQNYITFEVSKSMNVRSQNTVENGWINHCMYVMVFINIFQNCVLIIHEWKWRIILYIVNKHHWLSAAIWIMLEVSCIYFLLKILYLLYTGCLETNILCNCVRNLHFLYSLIACRARVLSGWNTTHCRTDSLIVLSLFYSFT